MDATGSMGNLLDSGKQTIKLVFERAKEILKETQKYDIDCFEVSIAFYRNYGSGEKKLLEASNWFKKPEDLEIFLRSNGIQGGQGNEAIEIGLWHANREYDKMPDIPLQILIIGDAPANSLEEVKVKREKAGVKWEDTLYKTPTYYEQELQILKNKGVKIFCFYVKNLAKNCFEKLTTEPDGCKFLDINNAASGSKELLDNLAKIILQGVGGKELQDSYDKKYKLNLK